MGSPSRRSTRTAASWSTPSSTRPAPSATRATWWWSATATSPTAGPSSSSAWARAVNGWSDEEDRGVQPPPIEEVVAKIRDVKPSMVCAPHVETSAGIILNKDYCKQIGDACKEVGATFCLDGVASGTAWIDMDYANIGAY